MLERMNSENRNFRNLLVTGMVICAFLGANVLTPGAFEFRKPWLLAVLVGICISQLNLIATWAALAPGNFMVRLPWSLLLAVLMWYALVVGNRIENRGFDRGAALFLGLVLLFGLLVALIPLVIAARFFRWRLLGWSTGEQVQSDSQAKLQFNLQHLLLSMFLLSVAMAPARLVLPEEGTFYLRVDYGLWVLLAGIAVCNVVVTVPCIWGAFATRHVPLQLAIAWPIYCVLITGIEFACFTMFLGSTPDAGEVFFAFYLMNLTQCATVFGTLLIFRQIGFRLVRRTSSSVDTRSRHGTTDMDVRRTASGPRDG
jgi:hypothetical protein